MTGRRHCEGRAATALAALAALALAAAAGAGGCAGGGDAGSDGGAGGGVHTDAGGGAGGGGPGDGQGGGAGLLAPDGGMLADGAGRDFSTAPPIPEADFLPTLERIFCEESLSCCTRGGRAFDAAACKRQVSSNVLLYKPPAAMFDPALGGACLQRARALATSCLVNPVEETDLWRACADAYSGSLPVGSSCSSEAACRGDPRGAVQCNGTCYLTIVVKVGEPCERSSILSPVRYFCTSPTERVECDGHGQICRPLGGSGQPCDQLSCDAGTFCHPGLQLCVPRLPAGSVCENDLECDPTTACANNRCVLRPGVGAACDAATPCSAGLICYAAGAAATCQLQQPVGGPCSSDDGCSFSTCMNGRCSTLALLRTCVQPVAP